MPTRLTEEREREILDAYQRWDPGVSSVEELAQGLGISRQTIYSVLRRHNVPTKLARPVRANQAPNEGGAQVVEVLLLRLEHQLTENLLLRGLVRALYEGEDLSLDQQRLLRDVMRP